MMFAVGSRVAESFSHHILVAYGNCIQTFST
jgi:hypothetical protein